jgi:alkaline phosphatase
MMVSDGFGPASQTYGRTFYKYKNRGTVLEGEPTSLDTLLVGTSRTRSSDSLVSDSAAGATAFSCAMKTYNGAIAGKLNLFLLLLLLLLKFGKMCEQGDDRARTARLIGKIG